MQERRALGRGLGSLIPMGGRSDSGSKVYQEVPIQDIVPNQEQPRKLFDKVALDELASSIEEKGLLQPLIVRRIGGGKFELIAGERRLRAAKQVKLEKIPVIIKDVDTQEALELALIENIQRQDLNPIEEALAFKELISKYQYTQDELAKRLGKDRSNIANIMRLLKLPESIRSHIISGQISMGHARALVTLENKELQEKLADEIIKNGLSVRDVENLMHELKEETPHLSADQEAQTRVKKIKDNPFRTLEEEIKLFLKTQVQIKGTPKRGKLIIHFHSSDELQGYYDRLLQR